MSREPDIALAVWRAVGRHLALPEALGAIRDVLGVETLAALRIEPGGHRLEPLACAGRGPLPARIEPGADAFHRLLDWLRREPVVAFAAAAPPAPVFCALAVAPGGWTVIHLPASGQRPSGLVLLRTADVPDAQTLDRFAALREPLAAALDNDLRLHALEIERARAEAERTSLLSHLGRETLSDTIVGADSGLQPVLKRVDQVARTDTSVLLLGETGSGKEVVARAIHERSTRAEAPFMRVNCGAIPPELIDSELFGHEKGSFTGAQALRRGWFERADGGSLLLDEVGELPLAAQVRLLRVLQEGSLFRVGGEKAVKVDVRIIAATHRDLAAMVQAGTFREDLWYRIAIFPILIPPLRERRADVAGLATHFARRAALKLGLPLQLPTAADAALLEAYDWPGNVREMAAVIERAAILGEGRGLAVGTALGTGGPGTRPQTPDPARSDAPFATLDEAMRAHIRAALERTGGRIEGRLGAARLLGINPNTLRSRMRKLGLAAAPHRAG
jgi:transcriptional regulator with GAF, ATPase, and Fis domain